MQGCGKCKMAGAVLFLLVGVAFLFRDVGVWDFWDIQGWTVLFLLLGLTCIGHSCCKDCQAMCEQPAPSKRK